MPESPFRNPKSAIQHPKPPVGLILGGSSCVGKTILAKSLCARFGLTHYQTDRLLPDNPTLNPLAGPLEIWDRPPQELSELLAVAANAAIPYISQQVEACEKQGVGWIVEGERIHPELVEHLRSSGSTVGLFIVESDAERLHKTLIERLPGFKALSESRQRCVAAVDRLYNLWLVNECARRDLDWVPSQPWPSLPARVLSMVRASIGSPRLPC